MISDWVFTFDRMRDGNYLAVLTTRRRTIGLVVASDDEKFSALGVLLEHLEKVK